MKAPRFFKRWIKKMYLKHCVKDEAMLLGLMIHIIGDEWMAPHPKIVISKMQEELKLLGLKAVIHIDKEVPSQRFGLEIIEPLEES